MNAHVIETLIRGHAPMTSVEIQKAFIHFYRKGSLQISYHTRMAMSCPSADPTVRFQKEVFGQRLLRTNIFLKVVFLLRSDF